MKNELKALYKKSPKLAKEVAKVLGYSIKAKTKTKAEDNLPDINAIKTKILKPLDKISDQIQDVLIAWDDIMDEYGYSHDIDEFGSKMQSYLFKLQKAIKKEF